MNGRSRPVPALFPRRVRPGRAVRFAAIAAAFLAGAIGGGQAAAQTVHRVSTAGSATGDGATWATAYADLKDALAAAALTPGPDEIWVAAGTYWPDPGIRGDITVSFELPGDVELLGGFAGDESAASQRDPAVHATILSGDLWDNDFPYWLQRLDNSLHVVTATDLAAPSVIDGFTISGGNADFAGADLLGGGGIFVERGDLTIRDCRFTENVAGGTLPTLGNFGAAVYVKDAGALTVETCRFVRNRANNGGAIGALEDGGPIDVTVRNSVFRENKVPSQSGGALIFSGRSLLLENCEFSDHSAGYGGAMRVTLAEQAVIRDCEFLRNSADVAVAAIFLDRSDNGGATPAVVENCRFIDHYSAGGFSDGTILLENTVTHMTNCEVVGSYNMRINPNTGLVEGSATVRVKSRLGHRFVNCLVADNFAGVAAGFVLTSAQADFVNCTVVNNRGGALNAYACGIWAGGSLITVDNTILWGNRYATGLEDQLPGTGGEIAQIQLDGAALTVGHTLVEGWSGVHGGVGNFDDDPLFADSGAGDLHLLGGSPAIDAGGNAALPPDVLTDLDDQPRLADGDGDLAAVVDLGVYEFPGGVSQVVEPGGDDGGLSLAVSRKGAGLRIEFALPRRAPVDLTVYDIRGRRVRVLAAGPREPGVHEAVWDETDAGGRRMASGVYIVNLTADGARLSHKITLVR